MQASMGLGSSLDIVENVLPLHYGFEHFFDQLEICIVPMQAADAERPYHCKVS